MRVRIARLGHLGDGIAKDGTFVPGALPGEVVEGEASGGRMTEPKIVEPSPLRVRAACPHYRSCGGCSLMHADPAFVADWKAEVVRVALSAQGISAQTVSVSLSPPRSRRRATFHARRTKSGALAGFHGRASGSIVGVSGCLLVTPALLASLPALERLTIAGASRKGELALTVTETESGLDVSVTGGKPADGPLRSDLARIVDEDGLGRLTWEGETVALRAAPAVRFGPARVELPPAAFLQATFEGETALVSAVTDTLSASRRVADLFSGAGTFAFPLALRSEVHAVEGDPPLLASLDRAARNTAGLKRITTEVRDLFRRPLLPDELARFDAVVLDPPRAGAEAQVAELARSAIPLIAHVSCNPATFARDARTLVEAGFRLGPVHVIDQFRWSPHVELVASFARSHIAA